MKELDINVAIPLEGEAAEEIIEWNQKLADRHSVKFVLQKDGNIPHISLYQGRYPTKNLSKIEKVVDNVSSDTEKFIIVLQGLTPFLGFVFYDVEENKQLLNLQEKVVHGLNSLREGLIIPSYDKEKESYSKERLANFEEYGNPRVFNTYIPHISIAKLDSQEDAERALALLPKHKMLFEVEKIVLTSIGKHGTCPEILSTYLLKA